MSWETRLLERAALAEFWPAGKAEAWPAWVDALLAQQAATWPQLQQANAGLAQIETREFVLNESRVQAQFNPQRLVSTAAKVDAASIQARPCFLCAANLPAAERGLPFGEDFVILCNPFPVLPKHLVIAARAHTPQAIEQSFATLLTLTRELGAEFFTLYNGPRCGASAPDHLHFQAAVAAPLPIWRELEDWPAKVWLDFPDVAAFGLTNYRINLLALGGAEASSLQAAFAQALAALAKLTGSMEEPLLNLLARYEAGYWTVLLLPRQRHRPSCYDAEGAARLTISPAAIDLGGVLVVPQLEHFARLDAATLAEIYREVSLAEATFAAWLKELA